MDQNCRGWKFYGHVAKLQTLEVLRSVFSTHSPLFAKFHKTADLGSSTVAFQYSHPPENWKCYKTASLGSSTVTFVSCLYNYRPWKFYGRFSVMWNISLENCRPWKFYGHFSVMTKTDHKTTSLSSFTVTVKELQTLEVLRSLFSDDGRTASLGSFVDTGWGTWGVLESSSFKVRVHLCNVTTN